MAQDHRDHQLLEPRGADLAVLLRLLRPPEKDRDRLVLEEGRQKAALVSLQWVRRSDGCTLLLGEASDFGEGEGLVPIEPLLIRSRAETSSTRCASCAALLYTSILSAVRSSPARHSCQPRLVYCRSGRLLYQ